MPGTCDNMNDFCHKCGRELGEDETVCPECGSVTEKGKAEGVTTFGKPVASTIKINPMIAVLAVAVLLCAASAGMSLVNNNNGTNEPYHIEYNWTISKYTFNCSLDIDKGDYTYMMKSDIDRGGTRSSSMYVRENVDGKIEIINGVSDYIVVDKYIEKFAQNLKDEWNKFRISDGIKCTCAQFVAYFVQLAIDYKSDMETKSQEDYWKYPLETLYDGYGDCEDGSILLAALLDALGYDAGIYLIPNHAVAAVSVESINELDSDCEGEPEYYYSHYFNARYHDYYPIETAFYKNTEGTDIGNVSGIYKNTLFFLYTGYSKTYFYSTPLDGEVMVVNLF